MSNVGITTESTNALSLRLTLLLAVAGQLLAILASFGWIRAWTIGLALVAAIAITRPRLRVSWLLLLFVPLLVFASYPPHAFDETLYHLPYIDSIARHGAIVLRPDIRFEVFPQLQELLALPAYIAFGATATHFVSVLQLMILGALLLAWPKRREAGWLAAAIVLGNPPLLYVGGVTYVDAALTLFVAAGFFCLQQEGDDYALLGGFLLGTALSVKYLGGFFVVAALLYVGRRFWRYALGVTLGALPMTLRLFVLTGNPLHPYFSSSDWAGLGSRQDSLLTRAEHLVRLLYDITFARQHVNFQPPYTPFFVLALIVAVFFAKRWRLGLICAVYFVLFVTILPADSRYLLPLVPLVAVPAASYLAERFDVRVLAAIAALPLVLYPLFSIYRFGPPPLSHEARHAFQVARVPGLKALEQAPRGRVFVCGGEELKYFGGDRLVGDHRGAYAFRDVFHRGLDALDVDWIVVSKRKCNASWRAQVAAHGERVYEDDEAELWKKKRGR